MKNRILNFIGFTKNNVSVLGSYHIKRLYHLCLSVFFTGFVSAVLIAFTLNTLFDDISNGTILFVAIIWFLLVVLIDRAIVSAKKDETDILQWIRLGVISGFIIIHSGAIDLEFFKGDIKTKIATDYQLKEDKIKDKYQPKFEDLKTKKEDLYILNNGISSKITQGRNKVYNEIDKGNGSTRGRGDGKIAKAKARLFKADSIEFEKGIALNLARIKKLDSVVAALKTEQTAEIANLPSYNDTGVVTRLSALHHTVFSPSEDGTSKLPMKLYYFAFLIVAITIEALPLIAKITYRDSVNAYHNDAEKDNGFFEEKADQNRVVKKNDLSIEKEKENLRFNNERVKILNSLKYKAEVSIQETKMEGEMDYYKSTEKHLDAIIEVENNAKEKYSKEHYNYIYKKAIKPCYDSFLDNKKPSSTDSSLSKKNQKEQVS